MVQAARNAVPIHTRVNYSGAIEDDAMCDDSPGIEEERPTVLRTNLQP